MNRTIKTLLQPLTGSSTVVNLAVALYIVVFVNNPFWQAITANLGLDTLGHGLFLTMAALLICLFLNSIFTLLSFRPVHKPLLIAVLLTAAVVNYYMTSYGVVINRQMITNLLETDFREASEQLTWPLLRHTLLFGLAPATLVGLTRITYRQWQRGLLEKGVIIGGSAVVMAALVLINFKTITLFGRKHPELRMYINPTYPLYSLAKAVAAKYRKPAENTLQIVAADATRQSPSRKSLLVMVVGETARAEEFSLNGYGRQTNPELAQTANLFNFTDVEACGTDTAESLPCMFFPFGRNRYSRAEASRDENLLDILQKTGVKVVWLDNNSGSKGVADRIAYKSVAHEKDPALCSSEECFDEIMLKDVDRLVAENQGEMLLVLHQKGSHGPSYYKRTPPAYKRFTPECSQDNVQDCSPQQIVNAYDNTIVYTDHFLAQLIKRLEKEPYPTAMLYASDHGESLGENNIYLHGLPFAFAPRQQKQVPLIFWGSAAFLQQQGIDTETLANHRHDHFSHDNLFHSTLGLFHIKSSVYRQDLDIFNVGRKSAS